MKHLSVGLIFLAFSSAEALSKDTPQERQMASLFKKKSFAALNASQKNAAKRWFALGKPNFSGHAAAGSIRLINLKYGNFTRVKLDAASRLVALKQLNFTKQQFMAAERLKQLGRANFTLADLKAGVRMVSLKQNRFSLPQAKAAMRLFDLGKRNFSLPELKRAQRLTTTGLPKFTNLQFLQTKRLVDLGYNNFSLTQLTAAEHLTVLGRVNFTPQDLGAGERYVIIGQNNFTPLNLTMAEKLRAAGHVNFTPTQVTAGEKLVALGHNNFTNQQVTAADQLVKLGLLNFNARELAAAEACVAGGFNTFSEIQLQTAIVRAAWPTMNQTQRVLGIVDVIFVDDLLRRNNGLPAAVNEQTLVKNILAELIRDGDFNPPALPNAFLNLRMFFPQILNGANKANIFMKYERTYHLNRQEARDFYAFNTEYNGVSRFFPLVEEKRLQFFRALQARFNAHDRGVAQSILMTLFANSLPMDHPTWPDFIRNPASNFNNFIAALQPTVARLRNSGNLVQDTKTEIEQQLTRRDNDFKRELNRKINPYTNANTDHRNQQLRQHGNKVALTARGGRAITFRETTNDVEQRILNMDRAAEGNRGLRERINYARYCNDPFMALLRQADQRLNVILNGDPRNRAAHPAFQHITIEVHNLKTLVLRNVPAPRRLFDDEFNDSFGRFGFGLDQNDPDSIKTVARLKRLYESVSNTFGAVRAAEVIYDFGAENNERCINGKRERLTELERQYVYLAGGVAANNDLDLTIGLNFAKLYMDHRTTTLRNAVNRLYDHGGGTTYAWFCGHRAMLLSFGLTGDFEDIWGGGVNNYYIDPSDFIDKYFQGGNVRAFNARANVNHNLPGFGVDQMANLALGEIRKSMGGLFDDNSLNHMLYSNLAIRRAYMDFKSNEGDAGFENAYFRNADLPLRQAIKPAAIKKILNRYGYIYERDGANNWI